MHDRFSRLTLLVLLWALFWSSAIAQPQTQTSSQSSSKARKSQRGNPPGPDPGGVSIGVYRNSFFGFSYKIPIGWVERTQEMREGGDAARSLLLLAVFERPPDAAGDTVNSAVVIAAESAASYPGLKTAAQYFGPLTELTQSKGFQVANQPHDFAVGITQLTRGDFGKDLGKVAMRQTSLVLLEKSYLVSFTFIGGGDDEVEDLIENLRFGTSPPGKPKAPH